MSVPLESIRFASEREFARNYFTHDEWDYQPCKYPLPARIHTTYTPDFYDRRRDVTIEVIGNVSVLYQRSYKYLLFRSTYPNIKYEIYAPNGKRVEDPFGNITMFSWRCAMGQQFSFQSLTKLLVLNPFRMWGVYDHRNANRSLIPDQVRAIRQDPRTPREIAIDTGIGQGIIYGVKAGISYRWVDDRAA